MTQGVKFAMEDDDANQLHLTREGRAQSPPRGTRMISRVRAIQIALADRVRAHNNIQVFENVIAVDLIAKTQTPD